MQVKIERFKNLGEVVIELGKLTILVGGNNSGKSSVLQAIQFGASVAQTSQMVGGRWSGGRVRTSIGQSELIYSPIKDVLSLGFNGQLRQVDAEQIQIIYTDDLGNEAAVKVSKGKNKNIRMHVDGQVLGEKLQSLDPPFCALVTGLAGIPSEEEFETKIVVTKAAAKGDSNSVFRNILLELKKDAAKWGAFSQQIQRMFPGYSIDVVFNPDVDETIGCTVNRGGTQLPIDTCGTGVLQAVQIFSYINLFAPAILLLDEPDSHLHPNNQKQLAVELTAIANSGTRVVVATHSRHIIEALLDEAKMIWMKHGKIEDEAEDYELKALIEIGALNVGERLTNPSVVVLTEDEDQSLIELLLEANGFDIEDCDVLSYSGCTNIPTALALMRHVGRSHPDAKFIIHRDRDFLSQDELNAYAEKFAPHGADVFVPDGNDLEYYFSSSHHIAETCRITEAEALEVIAAGFAARVDELTKKYVNTRVNNTLKSGEKPDSGAIAVECTRVLTGARSNAVHGKILLKGIRDELRRRGIADRILSGSAYLNVPRLQAMAPAVA